MFDESFNRQLRFLGCRLIEKKENRGKIVCDGDVWKLVFSPPQFIPKNGLQMTGYGHTDLETKTIMVSREAPVPVQKYVIIHELTHGLGYPEDAEAHLRATMCQPRGAAILLKGKMRQLTLETVSDLEKKYPKMIERGAEQLTEKGVRDIDRFCEATAGSFTGGAEYLFGIDRSRPRRTLNDEWTGMFANEW